MRRCRRWGGGARGRCFVLRRRDARRYPWMHIVAQPRTALRPRLLGYKMDRNGRHTPRVARKGAADVNASARRSSGARRPHCCRTLTSTSGSFEILDHLPCDSFREGAWQGVPHCLERSLEVWSLKVTVRWSRLKQKQKQNLWRGGGVPTTPAREARRPKKPAPQLK